MLDLNHILCFALWEWFLFCVFFLNLAPHLPCVLKLTLLSATAHHSISAFISIFYSQVSKTLIFAINVLGTFMMSYPILSSGQHKWHVLVAFKDSDQGLVAAQIQSDWLTDRWSCKELVQFRQTGKVSRHFGCHAILCGWSPPLLSKSLLTAFGLKPFLAQKHKL